MTVAVWLRDATVPVDPGAEATCQVHIRNTGAVVDQYRVQVVGDPLAWTDVDPATVNLLPGAEASVTLTFRPPRVSSVRAGEMPFAVKVMSHEDPGASVVEEGTLAVQPFAELVAELIPRTSRGSRVGRHELVVDNNGNQSVAVEILATDPDRLLEFSIDPSLVDVAPGTALFVKLRARPKKRFLKGDNKTLPFQAFVTPGGEEIRTSDGAMLQQAMLPKWTLKAVALVLVAVAALTVIWYAYLKPQVQSAATKAATQAVQHQSAKFSADAQAARKQASKAQSQASKAAASAAHAEKAAGTDDANGPSRSTAGTLDNSDPKTATDFRIVTSVSPGTPGKFTTASHKVPKKKVLWITDIVLQNSQGDTGTLQIRRGKTTLMTFGLADYRDIDYHFVQPIPFTASNPVTLAVDCQNPGKTRCTPSGYFDGQLVKG